jgi:DNA-binding response OmpR family regulator
VRSRQGRGSVFSIDLPLGDDARGARARTETRVRQTVTSLTGKIVLVIDDESGSSHEVAQQLRRWGVHVLEAQAGNAHETAGTHGRLPSAVVANDGAAARAAVERLRAELREAVPAILFAAEGTENRGADDAGYWHLSRPVRPGRLRALLSHLLGRDS